VSRRLAVAAVIAAGGAVAAAAPLPEPGFGLPRDASVDGARIDWLIHFTVVASTIIFALVGGMLLFSLIRHRRRHQAVYAPGSKASIGAAVGFIALVAVAVDGTLFLHTIVDMKNFFWNFAAAEEHPDVVRIEVQAHQWAWQARYPGPDGKFNTPDDVVTLNDVRVPVGAPVLVQLASRDVIHSFNLPHFRVKRDVVPGEITKLTFQAKLAGEYEIACAEHCGPNHYKMRGILTVLPPERYAAWLRVVEADARRAYDAEDAEAQWGWAWRTE
jgi:cytochrome c oxidase subunit II